MTKLEYIWIDGTESTPQLRSKTKVVEHFDGTVNGPSGCPVWGFDGSSTNQAPGDNSDCVLKPVRLYTNPLEENCYLSSHPRRHAASWSSPRPARSIYCPDGRSASG